MPGATNGVRKAEEDLQNGPTKKAKLATLDYTWEHLHNDLENGKKAGVWGGCNSAWWGLASIRAGVDMKQWHKKRSPDEFYVETLHEHLQKESTRRRWNEIVTMDPMGLYAGPPTISATYAHMNIPELTLEPDDKIVNKDGSINVVKAAVDYAWNIPGLAQRLGMDETKMRELLSEYTCNPDVLNPELKAFLPPVGGFGIYFFGDISKLSEPTTEIAVRVHDACCGSDVFGTDICTCRPYLVFAIQGCVETAKRGGVGMVVYFAKEGRSLGEVTKYRVYNARKRQKGGDRPEMYFYQTESIAGIRDARFQEMMPDFLLWLGINRIDWLLSMSSDKYEGITNMGIEVMQRVSLPDMYVPADAHVEISAKISAGYHTDSLDSNELIASLRALEMIRSRCQQVFDLAKAGKTVHFNLDLQKMPKVVDYVINETKKSYPDLKVPYHSRWRHFDEKEVDVMTSKWPVDKVEKVRRLVDLVTISVLLDAGAGPTWHYTDSKGHTHVRSEGLARASMDMFEDGIFSSDVAVPHRVNSHGLKKLTLKELQKGFQVSAEGNPMIGLEGRYGLLQRLATALEQQPEFFGKEVCRPGNLVDYVIAHVKDNKVSIRVLWKAVVEGFETIWPENLSGVRRGDVWVYSPLKKIGQPGSDMIPFHKLSQWLTYSLLEPLEQLGIKFTDMHLMTGLAEYRNGGLFVDLDVLTLKDPSILALEHSPGSELMVEWRALTICLLDLCAVEVRKKLGKTEEEMPLAAVLQGGTWAAGRSIAAEKRPTDKKPPITVRSDGTVF